MTATRHTKRTKERLLVSSERRFPEERLHGAGPNNQQASEAKVNL